MLPLPEADRGHVSQDCVRIAPAMHFSSTREAQNPESDEGSFHE